MNHANQGRNGNGATSADCPSPGSATVDPEVLPAYQPVPMPSPSIVVRRELVWAGVGVVAGVLLTLWILKACREK